MRELSLPIHPFSRRILLTEYGSAEPIQIRPNDILFSMLSLTQMRDRGNLIRLRDLLTAEVCFALDDGLATHISRRCQQVGYHLFRWHKDMLFRYVDVCLRRGGITAAQAIREFYEMYGIEEDDYSSDNAWRMWQRHNHETAGGKNPVFSGKIRGAARVIYSKKRGRPCKVEIPLPDDQVERMAEHLSDIVSGCLRSTPKALLKHARCYFYLHFAGRNHQQVSHRLRLPVSTIYYGAAVIRNWRDTDPTFRRLLGQVVALPGN